MTRDELRKQFIDAAKALQENLAPDRSSLQGTDPMLYTATRIVQGVDDQDPHGIHDFAQELVKQSGW